jgi:glucose uptake protein GlcU
MDVADSVLTIVVGVAIGLIVGGLIVYVRRRRFGSENPEPQQLDDQTRLAFKILLGVCGVAGLCFVAAATIAGSVSVVLPSAVAVVLCGIVCARALSVRA